MAKGGAKDKKPADKKGGDKGKGKAEAAGEKEGKVRIRSTYIPVVPRRLVCADRQDQGTGKGGLKAATAVNVRHILCEKHSKTTEALQRIQVR